MKLAECPMCYQQMPQGGLPKQFEPFEVTIPVDPLEQESLFGEEE